MENTPPTPSDSLGLPIAPPPDSGRNPCFIAYRAQVTRVTGLTVDEAARMVISGGLMCPDPRRFLPPIVPDGRNTP